MGVFTGLGPWGPPPACPPIGRHADAGPGWPAARRPPALAGAAPAGPGRHRSPAGAAPPPGWRAANPAGVPSWRDPGVRRPARRRARGRAGDGGPRPRRARHQPPGGSPQGVITPSGVPSWRAIDVQPSGVRRPARSARARRRWRAAARRARHQPPRGSPQGVITPSGVPSWCDPGVRRPARRGARGRAGDGGPRPRRARHQPPRGSPQGVITPSGVPSWRAIDVQPSGVRPSGVPPRADGVRRAATGRPGGVRPPGGVRCAGAWRPAARGGCAVSTIGSARNHWTGRDRPARVSRHATSCLGRYPFPWLGRGRRGARGGVGRDHADSWRVRHAAARRGLPHRRSVHARGPGRVGRRRVGRLHRHLRLRAARRAGQRPRARRAGRPLRVRLHDQRLSRLADRTRPRRLADPRVRAGRRAGGRRLRHPQGRLRARGRAGVRRRVDAGPGGAAGRTARQHAAALVVARPDGAAAARCWPAAIRIG